LVVYAMGADPRGSREAYPQISIQATEKGFGNEIRKASRKAKRGHLSSLDLKLPKWLAEWGAYGLD